MVAVNKKPNKLVHANNDFTDCDLTKEEVS